jgi:hypothetical protein
MVHGVRIQYFDTVAPSKDLNIMRTGHLFVAGEASNHVFYRFKSTGEDDKDAVVCVSAQTEEISQKIKESLEAKESKEISTE